MLELRENELVFSFPQVHAMAECRIHFQRTLRIPDDNREYPLPPGLGEFPVEHVDDHASRLPAEWSERGGVLLPMYQAEALWISFSGNVDYPFAVKIAAGKVNAVTGAPWRDALYGDPQDYLVVPGQPWLDGFCVRKGLVRQFVAMPLGAGYTAEEQLTGAAEHGGLQVIAYPMKREHYEAMERSRTLAFHERPAFSLRQGCAEPSMGLAPGGLMRQTINRDRHGLDAWDLTAGSRCFVHLLNSTQWRSATGKPVPTRPPTAAAYARAGLPWFQHYDDAAAPLAGAQPLAQLDSVAAMAIKQGERPLADNEPVAPAMVIKLGPETACVKDGAW